MKNSLRVIVLCLVYIVNQHAFAWSQTGHRWISENTFSALPEAQQKFYSDLFVTVFPDFKKTNKASAYASVGTFADEVRDEKLKDVFRVRGDVLPKALNPDARDKTNSWHYHNNAYLNEELTKRGTACAFVNSGKIIARMDAIDQLLFDPTEALSKTQQAILLAFQIHFIEDIHQPLHTFTALNARCMDDRGGNSTCVSYDKNNNCRENLHKKWDDGFDLFSPKNNATPSLEYSRFEKNTLLFSPARWAEGAFKYASDVYDKSLYIQPKQYDEEAKKIVNEQLALCRARLNFYLQRYYQFKQKNEF